VWIAQSWSGDRFARRGWKRKTWRGGANPRVHKGRGRGESDLQGIAPRRESIVVAQVCNGGLANDCNGDCSAAESFTAAIENFGQQHTTGLPR
jgi:hypothetical protein